MVSFKPFRTALLGPSRIFHKDREITHINWLRSKSRDLLVYLVHLGRPVEKEKIVEALFRMSVLRASNQIEKSKPVE